MKKLHPCNFYNNGFQAPPANAEEKKLLLRAYILKKISESGMNTYDLASAMNISPPTIYHMLKKSFNPTLRTLLLLEEALSLKIISYGD